MARPPTCLFKNSLTSTGTSALARWPGPTTGAFFISVTLGVVRVRNQDREADIELTRAVSPYGWLMTHYGWLAVVSTAAA